MSEIKRCLQALNCNNYHVQDNTDSDHWYAYNGWRSLWTYSKIADISFREICQTLIKKGEVTFNAKFEASTNSVTFTLI